MFQRVPKQRPKKKDPLMGTIESDPTYITFKENLLAEALENSKTGGKAVKQHYFETESKISLIFCKFLNSLFFRFFFFFTCFS